MSRQGGVPALTSSFRDLGSDPLICAPPHGFGICKAKDRPLRRAGQAELTLSLPSRAECLEPQCPCPNHSLLLPEEASCRLPAHCACISSGLRSEQGSAVCGRVKRDGTRGLSCSALCAQDPQQLVGEVWEERGVSLWLGTSIVILSRGCTR